MGKPLRQRFSTVATCLENIVKRIDSGYTFRSSEFGRCITRLVDLMFQTDSIRVISNVAFVTSDTDPAQPAFSRRFIVSEMGLKAGAAMSESFPGLFSGVSGADRRFVDMLEREAGTSATNVLLFVTDNISTVSSGVLRSLTDAAKGRVPHVLFLSKSMEDNINERRFMYADVQGAPLADNVFARPPVHLDVPDLVLRSMREWDAEIRRFVSARLRAVNSRISESLGEYEREFGSGLDGVLGLLSGEFASKEVIESDIRTLKTSMGDANASSRLRSVIDKVQESHDRSAEGEERSTLSELLSALGVVYQRHQEAGVRLKAATEGAVREINGARGEIIDNAQAFSMGISGLSRHESRDYATRVVNELVNDMTSQAPPYDEAVTPGSARSGGHTDVSVDDRLSLGSLEPGEFFGADDRINLTQRSP